jgi:hypothetical protein
MDDQRAGNRTKGTVEAERKTVKKSAGGSDVLGRRGKAHCREIPEKVEGEGDF